MICKTEKYDKNVKIYYKKGLAPEEELINISIGFLRDDNVEALIKIKDEPGRKVYKIALDGNCYYLKKYCYRKISKIIKNLFRPVEAFRAFKISLNLKAKDIKVVEPVTAVIIRRSLFIKDSLFITREFKGKDMQGFLANEDYTNCRKKEVIKKTASMWAELYNNKIINGDPNLPGILVNELENSVDLALVDMDNFKKLFFLSRKRVLKNLISFNAHSYSGLARIGNKRLTQRDRLLFFKVFLSKYKLGNIAKTDLKYIATETIAMLNKWGRIDTIEQLKKGENC